MKARAVVVIAALVLAGLAAPALCEEKTEAPAVSSSTSTDSKSDEHKDKERREKMRLEYEARREADRRKWEERYHGYRERNTAGDVIGTVIQVAAEQARMRQKFALGVVYAPGSRARKSAVGLQWLSGRKWGASVWLSGALDRDEDTIDAAIPHDDYTVDSDRGSYGLQGLYSVGSEKASLIVGAGLAVDQVMYTAVSNVTGWRWNNGSENRVNFAGSLACRLRIANRVSLSMGYDTHQSGFLGLSGDF